MFNSGLHIGWGIWRATFYGVWAITSSHSLAIFVIMAWSVGAFIGGFVGSIFAPMLWKESFYVSLQTDSHTQSHSSDDFHF